VLCIICAVRIVCTVYRGRHPDQGHERRSSVAMKRARVIVSRSSYRWVCGVFILAQRAQSWPGWVGFFQQVVHPAEQKDEGQQRLLELVARLGKLPQRVRVDALKAQIGGSRLVAAAAAARQRRGGGGVGSGGGGGWGGCG
jgi:hypothetical protein